MSFPPVFQEGKYVVLSNNPPNTVIWTPDGALFKVNHGTPVVWCRATEGEVIENRESILFNRNPSGPHPEQKLRELLLEVAAVFEGYAELHATKATAAADIKAARNLELAERCRTTATS